MEREGNFTKRERYEKKGKGKGEGKGGKMKGWREEKGAEPHRREPSSHHPQQIPHSF